MTLCFTDGEIEAWGRNINNFPEMSQVASGRTRFHTWAAGCPAQVLNHPSQAPASCQLTLKTQNTPNGWEKATSDPRQ